MIRFKKHGLIVIGAILLFFIVLNRDGSWSSAACITGIGLFVIYWINRSRQDMKIIQNWAHDVLDIGWTIHSSLGDYIVRGTYREKSIRLSYSDRSTLSGARAPFTDAIYVILEAPCNVSQVINNESKLNTLPLYFQSVAKNLWERPGMEEFQLVASSGLWSLLKDSRPIGFWPIKGFYLRRAILSMDSGLSNLKADLESLSSL